ncbi:hypothetical protein HDV00_009407 [Rhizophlyctis rosea]|nr:hypothetical protein HDV00_009407 [Rhizophlyctis rosea]
MNYVSLYEQAVVDEQKVAAAYVSVPGNVMKRIKNRRKREVAAGVGEALFVGGPVTLTRSESVPVDIAVSLDTILQNAHGHGQAAVEHTRWDDAKDQARKSLRGVLVRYFDSVHVVHGVDDERYVLVHEGQGWFRVIRHFPKEETKVYAHFLGEMEGVWLTHLQS